jgi:hypothetical protein
MRDREKQGKLVGGKFHLFVTLGLSGSHYWNDIYQLAALPP